ncbi:D-2-hydroxyacid dehydrogenase [Syntrophomonas erecta]
MLKLCILDANTLGEDADLSIFNHLGQVSIYQNTEPDQVVERIKDQDIVVTNKVILNQSNLAAAPHIKLICISATGTNNVDLNYTREQNIVVTNVAGYSTYSVVQHTFAMLFYLLESLPYYDNYVKSGQYAQGSNFTHLQFPFCELRGKTWGIIGLGTIGSAVAEIARAFGCQIVYYSTSGKNNSKIYTRVDLADLLKHADIISIHAPLNSQTINLINYEKLQLIKPEALLLNLGRGGIVNESDLAKALNQELIAGAGLDVLEHEPINSDNPLLQVKHPHRLLITPHIAWASVEARKALIQEIHLNIEAFLRGEKRNIVN